MSTTARKAKETSSVPLEGVLLTLDMDDILVDETNNLSRYAPNPKDVTELATDIVARGQLQPVVVRANLRGPSDNGPAAFGPPYRLVAGFQRYRAISQANEAGNKLPILARVVQADDREALLDNLAENIKRRNQTPMDIAYSIRALTTAGLNQKEISKEYGKSGSWVNNYSKLIELRPTIQKQIHAGEIAVSVARNLPQLSEEEQDEALEAVKQAAALGLDRGEAAINARQKKKGKSKVGAKPRGEVVTGKGGISAKAALGQFERLLLEFKEVEKPNRGQQKTAEVYTIMTKFLLGKFGAQAMDRKVAELF